MGIYMFNKAGQTDSYTANPIKPNATPLLPPAMGENKATRFLQDSKTSTTLPVNKFQIKSMFDDI